MFKTLGALFWFQITDFFFFNNHMKMNLLDINEGIALYK